MDEATFTSDSPVAWRRVKRVWASSKHSPNNTMCLPPSYIVSCLPIVMPLYDDVVAMIRFWLSFA
jgi:hypothetical protein